MLLKSGVIMTEANIDHVRLECRCRLPKVLSIIVLVVVDKEVHVDYNAARTGNLVRQMCTRLLAQVCIKRLTISSRLARGSAAQRLHVMQQAFIGVNYQR